MEIVMVITLAIMGVYFFKSTDLPKDLRERSAQFEAEASRSLPQTKTLRMTLPKELNTIPAIDKNVEAKANAILVQMKAQKKNKEIQLLNQEIDKLTLAITTLEQEIKDNNERNSEIQATIDSHLLSLISLQEQINLLA